jgi:hypothetical protein
VLKKIFSICALATAVSFAGVADPTLYTSGAAEPETPLVNINYVPNDEPLFAVSIYPFDMIWDAVYHVPSVKLSFEGCINSSMSLMTQPSVKMGTITRGSKDNPNRRDIDIFLLEISEGIRFYFNRGHRGWFMAGHFVYDRATLDYDFEYDEDADVTFKGNGFGFGFYGGHKTRRGHFTSSLQIGLSYMRYSMKSNVREDLDQASVVNAELDINYSIGFAF